LTPHHYVRAGRRAAWLFVLLMGAYPLLGVLITVTSLPSLVASVPIRAATLGLALVLLFSTPALRFDVRRGMFYVLIILCLLRLLWDSTLSPVEGSIETLGMFVFMLALPAMALLSTPARCWDEDALARLLFWVGLATCAAVLLIDALDLAKDRSNRLRGLAFDTVNTITLGHTAATTILAGLALRLSPRSRLPMVVLLTGAACALAVMAAAASRGPMVSLALCLLVLAFYEQRVRAISTFLFLAGAASLLLGDGLALERLLIVVDDGSTLQRLLVQANAIEQFLSNPVFGHAYVEPETMNYPHNLFIEAGMALGVVGLLLMVLVHFGAASSILGLLRQRRVLVPCLCIQLLSGALFSGSMYAGPQFWVALALAFAMTPTRRPVPLTLAAGTGSGGASHAS
jgi:O-antigen ligase